MRDHIKYTKQKGFDKQIEGGEKKALISSQTCGSLPYQQTQSKQVFMLSGARACRSNG